MKKLSLNECLMMSNERYFATDMSERDLLLLPDKDISIKMLSVHYMKFYKRTGAYNINAFNTSDYKPNTSSFFTIPRTERLAFVTDIRVI